MAIGGAGARTGVAGPCDLVDSSWDGVRLPEGFVRHAIRIIKSLDQRQLNGIGGSRKNSRVSPNIDPDASFTGSSGVDRYNALKGFLMRDEGDSAEVSEPMGALPDDDRVASRAEGRPPEEQTSEDPAAQAEAVLQESEDRIAEGANGSEPTVE